MKEENDGIKNIYEFKEANVMVLTRNDPSLSEIKLTYEYHVKDVCLNISYNNQAPYVFKVSDDRKTLTVIDNSDIYKLVN